MKKYIKLKNVFLLLAFVSIPIIIYFVATKVDLTKELKSKDNLGIIKTDFIEKTIESDSIVKKDHKFSYSPSTSNDGVSGIVMGNLLYSAMSAYKWNYSYTVRPATYCCDSYWPLIKVKDGEFGSGVLASYDYLGGRNDYEADVEFSRLPNRNGHLVYIEYNPDGGQRADLYKGLAYLGWQGITDDNYIQRVLWSSWVWHSSQGYGVDYMGSNYVLENKGVKDEFKMEIIKYYCGRDSYVPSDITPRPYGADSYYSYGGPSVIGKDGEWIEPRSGSYHDSLDNSPRDGTVSVAEQLRGRTVEEWRRDVIAGIEAAYGEFSRTIQFSTFEYQIIRRNFPVISTSDDIHVYVDQVDDTGKHRLPSYTFGPYRISMTDGDYNYGNDMCSNAEGGETLKLKELVYNEIVGGNFGQKAKNTFLTADFKVKVKYRNGKTKEVSTTIQPKYNDPNAYDDSKVHSYQNPSFKAGGAVLVDAEGNALEEGFPKFDEYFYIRYYVDDYENTLEKLEPTEISFKYIGDQTKMSGYRFKSKKLAYSIHYNICKYADRNLGSAAFSPLFTEFPNHGYYLNVENGHAWDEQRDGGEIYIYKNYGGFGDSVNVLDAIAELQNGITKSSNRLVTSKQVKVTWEDDLTTNTEDVNGVNGRVFQYSGNRTLEQDRVDGIMVDGCQAEDSPTQIENPYNLAYNVYLKTPPVSNTGKGFFPEYNDIQTFTDNSILDYCVGFNSYWEGGYLHSFSPQSEANGAQAAYESWYTDSLINPEGMEPAIINRSASVEEELKRIFKAQDKFGAIVFGLFEKGGLISVKTGNDNDNGVCDDCNGCDCEDECGCDDCETPCPCDCEDKVTGMYGCCSCDFHTLVFNESVKVKMGIAFYRDQVPEISNTGSGQTVHYDYTNATLQVYKHLMVLTFKEDGVDNNIKFLDMNYQTQKQEEIAIHKKFQDIMIDKLAKEMAEKIKLKQDRLKMWINHQLIGGAYAGLYVPYIRPDTDEEGEAMPFVEEKNDGMQPMITSLRPLGGSDWREKQGAVKLPEKPINMYLGGNVIGEEEGYKGDGYINKAKSGGGIEVSLYNEDLKMFVAVTTTDENGDYGFQYVNPLHQYKVVFKYNGMQYLTEQTYKRDTTDPGNEPGKTGGRVNSVESGTGNAITKIEPTNTGQVFTSDILSSYGRNEVNNRFTTIEAAENNDQSAYGSYTDKNTHPAKAYGWYTKIKNERREHVSAGTNGIGLLKTSDTKTDPIDFSGNNDGAIRYADVYNKFKEISTHKTLIRPSNEVYDISTYLELTPNGKDVAYDDRSTTNKQCTYKQKIEELNGILGDLSENSQVINYLENTFVTSVTDYYPYLQKTRYWLETIDESKDEHKPKENYPTQSIKIDGEIVLDLFAGKNSAKSWVYEVYNTKTGDVKDEKKQILTNQDQSRHVDTIIKRRTFADVAIDCDISKITLKANGNIQTYDYAALKEGKIKDKEGWKTDEGVANLHSLKGKIQESLLNGKTGYQRAINESEYLYNGSDYGLDDTRNLQVFVTYKIIVANNGAVPVRINEITDYYDSFYLQFFDSYENEQITRDNTDYNVLHPKVGSQTSEAHRPATNTEVGPAACNEMYKSLYLTNLNWELSPTQYKEAEITFEQTKDEHGRIHLTQDLQDGTILRPDMNIFEINSYTTYGGDSDIHEYRGLVTERSNVGDIESNDFYQNSQDYNDNSLYGHIKVLENPVYNRIEYDTVQAPNVAIFVAKDGQKPTITGNTFEDIRDTDSKKDGNSTKAVIGNGVYDKNNSDVRDNDDKDKPIDGVTVQLVELIKWVDDKGYTKSYETKNYSDDYYIGEKIWDSTYYKLETCDNIHDPKDIRRWQSAPTEYIPNEKAEQKNIVQRYSSGTGKSRVILNVLKGDANNSYLETKESDIKPGEYMFENVPPGDFVVRFIYGDTTDTVLVKDNDVVKLLNGKLDGANGVNKDEVGTTITDHESNPDNYGFLTGTGFIDPDNDGIKGKNDKSYNGQDFKSTIYQTNYASPNKSFKDIKGPGPELKNGFTIKSDDYKDYTNYVMQNYSNCNGIDMMYPIEVKTGYYNKDGSNDKAVKATLYYFDIAQSDDADNKKDKLSDAKDIDSFRQNSNNYARGYVSDVENKENRRDLLLSGAEDSSVGDESKNTKDNKENAITLRNYRAEVLASWKEIGTYTFGDYNSLSRLQEKPSPTFNENQSKMQKEMLIEFMKNTKMVAQTGVIRMQSEYNTTETKMDFEENMTMKNEGFIGTEEGIPENLLNYYGKEVNVKDDKYKHEIVDNVDLGLVERPEAQLRLDKKVTNVKIVLAEGETLFDTSKSVNNLYFGMHKGHKYYTIKNRLRDVTIGNNTKSSPELIQAYMDGELLKGATLDISYEFTIDNVGEVDYLDKQFYYIGTPKWTEGWNIARTNADEVLDYVSDNIRFDYNVNSTYDDVLIDHDKQQLKTEYSKLSWKVKGAVPSNASETLSSGDYSYYYIYPLGINSFDNAKLPTGVSNSVAINAASNNKNDDLINREYLPDVLSYDTLITTKALSTTKYNQDDPAKNIYESKQQVKFSTQYNADENESYSDDSTVYSYGLLPTTLDKNKPVDYMIKTQLVLSSTLSEDDQSLVYPNLAEIVRMSNSVGRRAFYSTVGNQPMANQNYGNDVQTVEKNQKGGVYKKYSKYNPVDVVTPIEIDADSSQSVRILPPTGFNKNNSNLYFAIIGAAAIIIVSIFMIKTGFSASRKKKRTKDIKRWM